MANGPIPPYGVAIHKALATGDLAQMRSMVTTAERYLDMTGDVRGYGEGKAEAADATPEAVTAALEELKKEISKLEGGS